MNNMDNAAAQTSVTLKDTTANPGPMGLMAFGMCTLLLNVALAGYAHIDSLLLMVEIFSGGLLQAVAGVLEWRKGNTFGCFTFVSAGFLWIELAGQLILPQTGIWHTGPAPVTEGLFLLCWTAISGALFIGVVKMRQRALQIVLGMVTVLFLLASAGAFTGNKTISLISDYVGIMTGVMSISVALKQLLEEVDKVHPH